MQDDVRGTKQRARDTKYPFQDGLRGQRTKEGCSDDIPHFFHGTTEFAACHARAQLILTDRDLLINDGICEVVFPSGHGTNEDCNRVRLRKTREVLRQPYGRHVTGECYFIRINREMICYGIFDYF